MALFQARTSRRPALHAEWLSTSESLQLRAAVVGLRACRASMHMSVLKSSYTQLSRRYRHSACYRYVCMYVCIVCVCMYVCMYVCKYESRYLCMHGWLAGWLDGWMDGWMGGWACVYVCMYACVYVCVYVDIYICVCM